jgi:hypothetical protein
LYCRAKRRFGKKTNIVRWKQWLMIGRS